MTTLGAKRNGVVRGVAPAALFLLTACQEREPVPAVSSEPESVWHTEPGFRFGGAPARDGGFGRVSQVRVSQDGQRVFILEPGESRVSAWTPEGRPLFDVGRSGEGFEGFTHPYRIHLGDSAFYVRDRSAFTWFAWDGSPLGVVDNPPASVDYQGFSVRVDALLGDGSFLGVPRIPARVRFGLGGNRPLDSLPLVRIRPSGQGWSRQPLFRSRIRGGTLVVVAGFGHYMAAHPYSMADRYRMDPGAGTVVVVRLAGEHLGTGEAELLEVDETGDALWRRRLEFEPVPLTRSILDATVDDVVKMLGPSGPAPRRPRDVVEDGELSFLGVMPAAGARSSPSREVIERALGTPEHLPAVSDLTLSTGGHIWLRTHERTDTLAVWYTVERGDDRSPLRRVLLPGWFRVMDATGTHVWGVWKDELDVNHVVGRRLVPAGR